MLVTGIMSLSSMADTPVRSKNAVGYVRVEIPATNLTIVAAPFDSLNSAGYMTLDELVGTHLHGNGDPLLADEIYMWADSAYNIAFLNDAQWDDPAIDNKWCYMDNSYPAPCASNALFNVEPGVALWINNRHDATNLYFMGEVPSVSTSVVGVVEGLMMVANPYPVEKTLDEVIPINSGAYANGDSLLADEVYLWIDGKYKTAFLNDASWGDDTINNKWCYLGEDLYPVACSSDAAYNLKPGYGFWYHARGGSFNLNVVKPYDWP